MVRQSNTSQTAPAVCEAHLGYIAQYIVQWAIFPAHCNFLKMYLLSVSIHLIQSGVDVIKGRNFNCPSVYQPSYLCNGFDNNVLR